MNDKSRADGRVQQIMDDALTAERAAEERRSSWLLGQAKRFVDGDKQKKAADAISRFAQEELAREEEAEAKERSDRMAAMLREELEKAEDQEVATPHDPAICLASAHWAYIEGIYRAHGTEPEKLEVIKYHYISAMIHGFKHGVEFARIGSVPIPATLESSNE